MEGIGAEVTQKIRSAIKAKLTEIGVYVDEELPDYVMVMVVNKRSKKEMDEDLQLFLGKHTSLFTSWLHQVLQKLQEVTVPNLGPGGIKRKLSDDYKKKKKSKSDSEKKDIRKKIKVEPEDDEAKEKHKAKATEKDKKESLEISEKTSKRNELVEHKDKEKDDTKTKEGKTNESSFNKQTEILSQENTEARHKLDEEARVVNRSKSHSISSLTGDIDDDDCINIRTDGELLETTEELNLDDISRKNKNKDFNDLKPIDRGSGNSKRATLQRSPPRQKQRSKPDNSTTISSKDTLKRHTSPILLKPNEKVVDARELLNKKKAAKQSDRTTRSRSREKSWSASPPHRKQNDDRDNLRYRENRENRKMSRERELSNRRNRRERKSTWDRDSKNRGDDESSRRDQDLRNSRRNESSSETASKKVKLERPFRNKINERESSMSETYKGDVESSARKRDLEEPVKRSGLVSHVVAKPQEPEDTVETAVPSVVKVTSRPRRPPSQQPSSNLIMKAISEANKSLANIPQRPDSTQRARKDPVFTRTLRHPKRISSEKIAVFITNHKALEIDGAPDDKYNVNNPSSLQDEVSSNRSSRSDVEGIPITPETDKSAGIELNPREEGNDKEKVRSETGQKTEEPEIELEIETEMEHYDQISEMSDPQFVVTLNGYDPDGLFSQSGEEGDNEEWLKETLDEPLLTSTPNQMRSPLPSRISSPVIFKSAPTVNHSNLIEVEIVKPKSTERCKYWPACKLGEKCTFYHPTKPCKVFPACKFGDTCLYIHPQCKFNALCTRKGCVFAHTPAHTPLQPPAIPKTKAMYTGAVPPPCKYYPNCTNINCPFIHPLRACRFGSFCTKKDCSFDHGKVAPVDKLKWTRLTT